VKRSFQEAAAFGLGGGELCFQPVAQSHQFIDFGDDALLLGERRDRYCELSRLLDSKYSMRTISLLCS
jgi:hypothetical protein